MDANSAGPISDALLELFGAVPDPDLEARFADLADLDLDSSESPPASACVAVHKTRPAVGGARRSRFSLPLFVGDELEAPAPSPVPDDERPDENNPQRVPRFG